MTGSRTRDLFLAAILAITGGAIIADQVAIVLVQILPATPGVIGWRYGAVGLTVGRATPLLLANLLLMLALILWSSRLALRLTALLHLGLAAVLAAVLGAFVLDAVQILGGLPESGVPAARAAAARAAFLLVLLIGTTLLFAWLLWRHAGAVRAEPKPAADRSVLVVGAESREAGGGAHGAR